ncbi:MAG: type II toxin-antitoxin system RelE/ParE family toxin [Methylococcales bacterium]|nr:type II toxin-antitoxin system RelE/ParE family toxin [Methylococcales bacterium]
MPRLLIRPEAESDLDEIWRYIAQDNPANANVETARRRTGANLFMNARRLPICLSLLLAGGCSSIEDMQHIGYYAVQNMGRSQCQKRMADDCNGQQSFDNYQQQRQAAEQSKNP